MEQAVFVAAPATGLPDPLVMSCLDTPHLVSSTPPTDVSEQFGFISTDDGQYALPEAAVMFEAIAAEPQAALIDLLKTIGVPSRMGIVNASGRRAFYRLADLSLLPALQALLPDGVSLRTAGEAIDLANFDPSTFGIQSVADLTVLAAADIKRATMPVIEPVVTGNALLPFSLRGQADKFKRLAIEATPLLGEVCLKGQVTIWYAGPNTGKTLLALSLAVDAVREGRIAAGNIFYINADDNGSGFATKLQILDDLGAHTLSPGFRNLRREELVALLHQMADQDDARGVLVIVDTIKKFASLMDKKESTAIAQAFRQVAMKGGSVLGLAHTTKNANADGTARYAGTSDLVDDADAVYTIGKLSGPTEDKETVVEFRRIKARGDSAQRAAYAYAGEPGVKYEELLASVRLIDADQIDEFKRIEEQRSDAEIIAVARTCIEEGINTKMVLAKEIASRINVSGRAAGKLLERYTGDDPAQHHWHFKRGERGAHIFELLPLPQTPASAPT